MMWARTTLLEPKKGFFLADGDYEFSRFRIPDRGE